VPSAPENLTATTIKQEYIIMDWSMWTGDENNDGWGESDSEVTSYKLYWDNGVLTDNWGVDVTPTDGELDVVDKTDATVFLALVDEVVSTYTVTGLTAGRWYLFTVRARNVYGYGAYSDLVRVHASDVPGQVSMITTTVSGDGWVTIEWTEPDINEEAITQY